MVDLSINWTFSTDLVGEVRKPRLPQRIELGSRELKLTPTGEESEIGEIIINSINAAWHSPDGIACLV